MDILSKSKIISLLGTIGLLFGAVGCSDSGVEAVKNGAFNDHQDISIATVMKERFDDGEWSSRKEGRRSVVIFKGKISKVTHDLAIEVSKEVSSSFNTLFYQSDSFLEMGYPIFYKEYQSRLNKKGYTRENAELDPLDKKLFKIFTETKYRGEPTEQIKQAIAMYEKKIKDLQAKLKTAKSSIERDEYNYHLITNQKFLKKQKEILPLAVKYYPMNEHLEASRKKLNKIKRETFDEAIQKQFWPVGSEVIFTWIINSDGKGFELDSAYNQSWKEFGFNLDRILRIVCAK